MTLKASKSSDKPTNRAQIERTEDGYPRWMFGACSYFHPRAQCEWRVESIEGNAEMRQRLLCPHNLIITDDMGLGWRDHKKVYTDDLFRLLIVIQLLSEPRARSIKATEKR